MTATEQDVDLAIWSLITFCVFAFVLKKYAWGPLIGGLDKREGGVLDNIAAAEAAVGLALIISIFRHYQTTNVEQIDSMKG